MSRPYRGGGYHRRGRSNPGRGRNYPYNYDYNYDYGNYPGMYYYEPRQQYGQYYGHPTHNYNANTNTHDRQVMEQVQPVAPVEHMEHVEHVEPAEPVEPVKSLEPPAASPSPALSQPKKKSLMKFTKKKLIKVAKTVQQPTVVFEDDEDDEDDNAEDAELIHKSDKIDPIKPPAVNNSDENDDENDDLDQLLVSLEKKQPLRPKLHLSDDEDSRDDGYNDGNNTAADNDNELLRLMSKKEKEIPQHQIQTYPIEKSFYVECDFIRGLTADEVRQLRDQDLVRVRGRAAVKPILEWNQLGLPAPIAAVLDSLNYPSPTPIQCEALPNIMSGLDFIGIAETGSGKTIAFLLPLFRQLLSNPLRHSTATGSTPRAIILTPTRELAIQIARAAKPFAENLGITVAKCYGGQSISGQIADLKRHADVVIGTPGRIIDLLCTNNGRILNLGHVSYFVMDEADRMLDLGFEPQIVKIIHLLRKDRQNVFFSATFPPKMQGIARKYTHGPVEVLVGSRNAVNENIEQRFEVLPDEESKFPKLLQILGSSVTANDEGAAKTIIFVERQNSCDQIVKQLLRRGYPVMALHGGKDQMEREGTVRDLKNGVIDIIVATSIASRGLDVEKLNLVVNYDSPSHIEDYVHRVGRTGRAGNKGTAVTFLTPEQDKLAYELVKALHLSSTEKEVPEELVALADKYEAKLKSGEASLGSGFAGKGGLEKLQQIRESNFNLERKVYLEGETVPKSEIAPTASVPAKATTIIPVEFLPYNEKENIYSAKLFINDFSQKVRMEITSREQYSRVVELTNASVTTRSRFYPPGTGTKRKQAEEDKLHVLVESPSERDVAEAISLFEESARRGIEREALSQQ